MTNIKYRNSIFAVLFEGIKIYISNIDKFVLFMLFPVFGQLIGLGLTFGLTLGLAPKISQKANSMNEAVIYIFLLALPGLLIFIKAFWDYMVAYVALNSMTEGAITTGRVYDFQSHRQVATSRSFKFIAFLLAVGFLSCVASMFSIVPILGIIPPLIIWVYFILVYQIFTFEEELSIKDYFKRSYTLIRGDWGRTFILMLILGFFSIYIITIGVGVIFDLFNLTTRVSTIFDFIGQHLPLEYVNKALRYIKMPELSVAKVSLAIFNCVLTSVVAGLSLPVRSICYTIWYKTLSQLKDGRDDTLKKIKKSKKNMNKDEE